MFERDVVPGEENHIPTNGGHVRIQMMRLHCGVTRLRCISFMGKNLCQ